MGSVYLAEHVLSRKQLALKIVHPHLCRGPYAAERFKREVSAAAEIGHPGIVQVYDAGVDETGAFFMAMELLQGETLGDRLRRSWPGMRTAVQLVRGMLDPLSEAHARGFVHRDLKPDNIFLAVDDHGQERVKLLDFGLAREVSKSGPTRTGITFGTPEYMSPEQAISARQVRPPGDVWSVGAMCYELLSGRHPFHGETPNAVMANAIKEPLTPLTVAAPHVPEPLGRFVEQCLEKQPEARPPHARAMLEGLDRVLDRLTLSDVAPTTGQHPTSVSTDMSVPPLDVPFRSRLDGGAASKPARSGGWLGRASRVPSESGPAPRRPRPAVSRYTLWGLGALSVLMFGGALGALLVSRTPDASSGALPPAEPSLRPVQAASAVLPRAVSVANAPIPPGELPSAPPPFGEEPSPSTAAKSSEGAQPPKRAGAPAEALRRADEPDPGERARQAERRLRRHARPAQPRRPRRLTAAELDRVEDCYRLNRMRCVLEGLRGRARTARQRVMLINASERTLGRPASAPLVHDFLRRHPRHAMARIFAERYQHLF